MQWLKEFLDELQGNAAIPKRLTFVHGFAEVLCAWLICSNSSRVHSVKPLDAQILV